MLLLLAGYANGVRKKRSQTGARLPQRLPQPAWFATRLQSNGLLHILNSLSVTQQHCAGGLVKASITAIAYVKPGAVYAGPLTPCPWNREADLLWKYEGCPNACYSLQIADVVTLDPPAIVNSARGYSGNVSLMHHCFQPRVPVVSLETLVVHRANPDQKQRLGHILSMWGLEDNQDCLPDVPVLWVPDCIMELLKKDGQWNTLLLNLNSHHWTTHQVNLASLQFLKQIMAWPSDEQFAELRNVEGSFRDQVLPLTADIAAFLIDAFRQNAERFQPGALQDFERQLQTGLGALLDFADGFTLVQDSLVVKKRSAEELIRCVVAAQGVRNRNKMNELQQRLLTNFVPPVLQDAAAKMIRKALHGSTISRAQAVQTD